VKDSLYTQGRRGVGTTVLAEKITGAAAEAKFDLQRLADLCRRVSQNGSSMGVALTSCTVPARGSPTFDLAASDLEVGIGIHGEPGRERLAMRSADEIAEMLTLSVIEDRAYRRPVREWDEARGAWREVELTDLPLKAGDEVLLFVNGMGGTPLSELYIFYRKAAQVCTRKGLKVVRSLVGSYMTSLEMQGASVTLLRLDEEMLRMWDAPVDTPGLRWGA
jgi:dihydroxyacetone kinase-like protein